MPRSERTAVQQKALDLYEHLLSQSTPDGTWSGTISKAVEELGFTRGWAGPLVTVLKACGAISEIDSYGKPRTTVYSIGPRPDARRLRLGQDKLSREQRDGRDQRARDMNERLTAVENRLDLVERRLREESKIE